MCCQAGCFFQSHLIHMSPFAPLACLLAHLEDRFCYLVEDLLGFEPRREAPPQLIAAGLAKGWQAAPAGATSPRYVVRYQLTGAELREGRVVSSYVAPCVRLFDTDELNVIWAEMLDELGTSPYRLGLEIQAIEVCPLPV
jgi:hypothetical protein